MLLEFPPPCNKVIISIALQLARPLTTFSRRLGADERRAESEKKVTVFWSVISGCQVAGKVETDWLIDKAKKMLTHRQHAASTCIPLLRLSYTMQIKQIRRQMKQILAGKKYIWANDLIPNIKSYENKNTQISCRFLHTKNKQFLAMKLAASFATSKEIHSPLIASH